MGTITIGVDLAKCVFVTCELDASGRVIRRRELGRDAFALWLAQVPAGTVVAMEACSSAHYWVPLTVSAKWQQRVRPTRREPD